MRARWWWCRLDPVEVHGGGLDLSWIWWRGVATVRSNEVDPSGGGSGGVASSSMEVASIRGGSGQEVPGSDEEEPSGDGSTTVASMGIRTALLGGGSNDAAVSMFYHR